MPYSLIYNWSEFCRTQLLNMTQQVVESAEPAQLALHPDQCRDRCSMCLRFTRGMYHTVPMHSAGNTTFGSLFRDSRSLQSPASRESLKPGEFVDTGENRLNQGILSSPSEIP